MISVWFLDVFEKIVWLITFVFGLAELVCFSKRGQGNEGQKDQFGEGKQITLILKQLLRIN